MALEDFLARFFPRAVGPSDTSADDDEVADACIADDVESCCESGPGSALGCRDSSDEEDGQGGSKDASKDGAEGKAWSCVAHALLGGVLGLGTADCRGRPLTRWHERRGSGASVGSASTAASTLYDVGGSPDSAYFNPACDPAPLTLAPAEVRMPGSADGQVGGTADWHSKVTQEWVVSLSDDAPPLKSEWPYTSHVRSVSRARSLVADCEYAPGAHADTDADYDLGFPQDKDGDVVGNDAVPGDLALDADGAASGDTYRAARTGGPPDAAGSGSQGTASWLGSVASIDSVDASPAASPLPLAHRVVAYVAFDGVRLFWIALYLLVLVGVTSFKFLEFMHHPFFPCLGWTLPLAKVGAYGIMINTALIILCMCKQLHTALRRTRIAHLLPLDAAFHFHKVLAALLLPLTALHVASHVVNGLRIKTFPPGPCRDAVVPTTSSTAAVALSYLVTSSTAITGYMMIGALLVIMVAGLAFRLLKAKWRLTYDQFYAAHYAFIPFVGAMLIHGSRMLLEWPHAPAIIGVPVVALAVQKLHQVVLGYGVRRRVVQAYHGPGGTLHLEFDKDSLHFVPGQYVNLCCPHVSRSQWHPFSITSITEDLTLSLNISAVGDWTRAVSEYLVSALDDFKHGRSTERPYVFIDGPYGAPAQHIADYPVSVLIATGIGITPFASALKAIRRQFRHVGNKIISQHIYLYWLARDKEMFEDVYTFWRSLEDDDLTAMFTLNLCTTGPGKSSADTALRKKALQRSSNRVIRNFIGRPDWRRELWAITRAHAGTNVEVFFCGAKPLGRALHGLCRSINTNRSSDQASIVFRKEIFL